MHMQCKDVENKFIPFIDEELDYKELKAFLEHIRQCENCYEEYDFYYTMIMGMRYLENDNSKAEFTIDSERQLDEAEHYILQYKILRGEKILLLIAICAGLVLLL